MALLAPAHIAPSANALSCPAQLCCQSMPAPSLVCSARCGMLAVVLLLTSLCPLSPCSRTHQSLMQQVEGGARKGALRAVCVKRACLLPTALKLAAARNSARVACCNLTAAAAAALLPSCPPCASSALPSLFSQIVFLVLGGWGVGIWGAMKVS